MREHANGARGAEVNDRDRRAWTTGLEEWMKHLVRAMDVADSDRNIFVAVVEFGVEEDAAAQDVDARFQARRRAIRNWVAHLQPGDLLTWHASNRVAICLARRSPSHAVEVIQRLRSLYVDGLPLRAGIAMWNGFESSEMLVARAEFELSQAKELGVDGPRMGPWLKSRLRSTANNRTDPGDDGSP